MNPTLRTRLATAALLLVPAATLVAAQPAAAQERFDHDRGGHSQRFDRRAPDIYDVTPNQGQRVGERGLTDVAARFRDEGSGIDARTVKLRLDGRDVTHRSRVDGNDVKFAGDLRPGRHVVEVTVRDHAGNLARRSWAFNVMPERGYGRDHRG